LRAGEAEVGVLGVRVKAKQGDALIQRVTLKSTNQNVYTKVFSSLALYDGATKLAEITNPASAYVKSAASDYRVTFSGFSALVSKDGYKDLVIKGTLYSSIDSTYRTTYNVLSIPANGVRALDGANIDQYTATALGTRSIVVELSESEQATLSISKDASSPKAGILVSDSDGKLKEGEMLVLALTAKKGRVKVTDIMATTSDVTTASFTALYLYDGTNLIASVGASDNTNQTFSDLTGLYVDKDQTKLLTIKADFTGATSTALVNATVEVETGGITAEKDDGTSITATGSTATSAGMRVTALAPVITLTTFTATWSRNAQESTGTLAGVLTVGITAKGGDVYIHKTAGTAFGIVKVNVTDTTTSTASGVMYDGEPTNVDASGASYKIAENQTATFKVKTSESFAYDGKIYYLKTAVGDTSKIDWGTAVGTPTNGTDIDFFDTSVWQTNKVVAN